MSSSMRKIKGWVVAACCAAALALCALVPGTAVASTPSSSPDALDKKITLTVYNQIDSHFAPGCEVKVYRVADLVDGGTLSPVWPYSGYGLSWDISDSSSAQALANALEGYVLRDGVTPTDSGVTDANGVVVFPSKSTSLIPGYYLVLTESHVYEGNMYEASPSMLALPNADSSGYPVHQVGITPKLSVLPSEGTTDVSIVKVWKDDGKDRPSEVCVQLLRDGSVYDTAVLNAANGWQCTWKGLSNLYKWTAVEEDVPAGYEASVVKDQGYIQLVNDRIPGEEEPPKERLPQTGQLWWPVPVLFGLGIVLFGFGLVRRRGQ